MSDNLKSSHDNYELGDIQDACLSILKKVKEICEKYRLRYFLAYGTLLGAIRHKGFIPWDDDIDIWMPRQDHERFIEIALKEIAPYTVNYYSIDNEAFYKFKPLLSIEDHKLKVGFELNGITQVGYVWIDIIAMDGMPRKRLWREIHCFSYKVWYAIIGFARSNKTGVLNYKNQSMLKKIGIKINQITRIGDILNPVSCINGFKRCKMKYDFEKAKFIHGSTNEYIDKSVFPKEWFDGHRQEYYEGELYRIPMEAEKVLQQLYGDYLTLPPEEKRVQKHYHIIKE